MILKLSNNFIHIVKHVIRMHNCAFHIFHLVFMFSLLFSYTNKFSSHIWSNIFLLFKIVTNIVDLSLEILYKLSHIWNLLFVNVLFDKRIKIISVSIKIHVCFLNRIILLLFNFFVVIILKKIDLLFKIFHLSNNHLNIFSICLRESKLIHIILVCFSFNPHHKHLLLCI